MSFSIKPDGDFEYTFEGESYQAEIEQVGDPVKIAGRSFKEDTDTWAYKFGATLVDDSIVTWDVSVEVGDSPFHDTSSSGVSGLPEGVEVEYDPEFECEPDEDDDY
ncbi:hypothetical protein QWJ20_01260 [Pectobacterium sp. S5]|uniref:hypothetical protein n=1 Tax=Pectobacterium TaxID=122277 RepID=UPI003D9B1EFD